MEDLFSGAEQLVESFFVELAAQLKLRPGLAEVGKDLEDYGEAFSGLAWLPLVGPWIERGRLANRILSKMLQRRKEILPELKSLSSKLELITAIGYRENAGHKLVSEPAATALERAWREEVRSASVEDLVREHDLVRVLFLAKRDTEASEDQLGISDLPDLTLAILRGARSDVRSQSLSSRSVRRSPRLAWDVLIELYGDETALKERLEKLQAAKPEGEDDLLDLADKYAGGWRPKDFGDD